MVQSGGDIARGPFVTNGDSPCAVKTYTPLTPGSDGGLETGEYQPQPVAPFDAAHNGAAARILQPAPFFAVKFAVSTNATDPQTGSHAAPPTIESSGGKLSGDLGAWGVAWNGQQFNQGAPKPGGKTNTNTISPRGTYDSRTETYTLQWTSQIAGGPFNGFTGIWHLAGTFKPKS